MDIRRLHAFAKIVDIGSITRASAILNIAQPALSQQIAALETHFGKPLLVRSKRGVVPTEAGKVLYRHCQIILKQMDQAELEVTVSTEELSGFVSVGIAALSLGPVLATRFLMRAREEFPGIVLYVNESVGGGAISEQIMAGKMDMALIYDPGDLPGLCFEQVRTEELFLVTRRDLGSEADEVTLEEAVAEPLILPSRVHTVRQVLETALIRSRLKATVVAHTESISVLAGGIQEGLGGTILPWSAALSAQKRLPDARIHRIRKPNMKVTMAICTSAQLPQSEPARAIKSLLVELSEDIDRPEPTN